MGVVLIRLLGWSNIEVRFSIHYYLCPTSSSLKSASPFLILFPCVFIKMRNITFHHNSKLKIMPSMYYYLESSIICAFFLVKVNKYGDAWDEWDIASLDLLKEFQYPASSRWSYLHALSSAAVFINTFKIWTWAFCGLAY